MAEQQNIVHRDLSWLDFNYRVLQEANDTTVPLFERIKFLAIYSSNLDEFFRVRVANHRHLVRVGKKTKKALDIDPVEILLKITAKVNKQQSQLNKIFRKKIIPDLKKEEIFLKEDGFTKAQSEFIVDFFQSRMLPFVQPVLLVKDKIRPFLNNGELYLVLDLQDLYTKKKELAITKIPSDHLSRFIELPGEPDEANIIILDDIVRYNVHSLFPGYDIKGSYSIKLTRDAELHIEDEYSGDLVAKIKKNLQKRKINPASRMVYDKSMPTVMLKYLKDMFNLEDFDLLQEGKYHNNSDFFGFPHYNKHYLKDPPLPPLEQKEISLKDSIFDVITNKDFFNHVPYHDYEAVVKFFEDAAEDPKVTHIKIVQYRVAKESRIMNALIRAVSMGKQVSAFIEVKARFDEEANLIWGEKLEQAGVKVMYSFPGLKVHSKIAMVRRMEDKSAAIYAYLSTGNFNEDTAFVYSDFGIFTKDTRLTSEITRLFSFLETTKVPTKNFKHLLIGQLGLRMSLLKLIDQEIANHKAGKKSGITLKLNSLQDQQMIEKLYKASEVGVKIKLIIRGICTLVPDVEGMSSNIQVISIVDRFLEHSRIYVFNNNDNPKIYLSSADWMTRNLSHRIEVAFPVYDEKIREVITTILRIQWNDNIKARWIHPKKNNKYRRSEGDLNVRSQVETYYYIKRVAERNKISKKKLKK